MQLDLFKIEEDSLELLQGETCRTCKKCNVEKPMSYFHKAKRSSVNIQTNKPTKIFYKRVCIECMKQTHRDLYYLKKKAPPKPTACDCCGIDLNVKSGRKAVLDHDHNTNTFRGWLCSFCNLGLGYLNDDVEGVEKALAYLKAHYE